MPICPRCGAPYKSVHYKIVKGKRSGKGRKYAFAYHGKGEDGRPIYCYLGPAEGYAVAAGIKATYLAGLQEESFVEVLALLESIVFRRRREAQGAGGLERVEIWRKTVEDLERLRQVLSRYIEEAKSELREAEKLLA